MPAEIPLFLLPAFAGVPAIPPERMAIMRARQRMQKFRGLLAGLAESPPGTGVDKNAVIYTLVADANRTRRAIDHALKSITEYEHVRPHDEDKTELMEFLQVINELREDVIMMYVYL
jgi:hypothetical protein